MIPKKNEELQKFQEHKLLALKTNLENKYRDMNEHKKSERCKHCGNWLKFNVFQNKETGEVKRELTDARFCQVKWCPMCAWLKSRNLANELKSVLQQIEEKRKVGYLFLTLTIKNPPLTELREKLKEMSKAFELMVKNVNFKKSVKGYMRAFEFLGDSTKQGEAHPHIHAILVVDKNNYFSSKYYIKQDEWVEMWKNALKSDYTPIVHITRIKAKNEQWKEADSAIFETIKYCAKPLEVAKLDADSFKILDKETKGIRQYNKGGLIKTTKPKQDDEISSDLWELMTQEFYKWSNKEYGKK